MCLLIALVLRFSLNIQVKFIGPVLIRPLGVCVCSSISVLLRQPLSVWVYISTNTLILPVGACINTVTGWAYKFIFLEIVLILPLGVRIETAIGRIGLHLLGQY